MDIAIDGVVTILAEDARITKPPLSTAIILPECDQPSPPKAVNRAADVGSPWGGIVEPPPELLCLMTSLPPEPAAGRQGRLIDRCALLINRHDPSSEHRPISADLLRSGSYSVPFASATETRTG